MKVYFNIRLISLFFLMFSTSKISSQIDIEKEMKTITSLDDVIILDNPNLMYNQTFKFDKENYTKKGINYEVYSYTNKKYTNIIKLFDIIVESFHVIVLRDEIIFIGIELEVNNTNIKHIEEEFAKYLGMFNQEVSINLGGQRELYYNKDKTGYFLDAITETDVNGGSLDVGYATEIYIELEKSLRDN